MKKYYVKFYPYNKSKVEMEIFANNEKEACMQAHSISKEMERYEYVPYVLQEIKIGN